MVKYKSGEDRGLDMHIDDSDVTLNVCLGREFTGSGTLPDDDDARDQDVAGVHLLPPRGDQEGGDGGSLSPAGHWLRHGARRWHRCEKARFHGQARAGSGGSCGGG